jgi:hypothetical protein
MRKFIWLSLVLGIGYIYSHLTTPTGEHVPIGWQIFLTGAGAAILYAAIMPSKELPEEQSNRGRFCYFDTDGYRVDSNGIHEYEEQQRDQKE